MKALFRTCLLMFTVFSFAGCGGGSNDGEPTLTPKDNTEPPIDNTVKLGSFIQGAFIEGVIKGTQQATLSTGDTAQLSVYFVDQDDVAYTGPAEILFASDCINNGQSEIDPAITDNTSGTVLATYTVLSCDDTDIVTATSSVEGVTLTATITIQTEQPPLGALQFISANPQVLALKGTEGTNDQTGDGRDIGPQSTVTFRVTSDNGGPLPNQQVNFELVTGDSGTGNDGGDAYLSRYVDFTDTEGLVSTVVNPGTTSTPLRVRATAERNNQDISAVSSRLVVTTGIPDQDSFSLSVSTFNIDGWAYDGIETDITIRAADRFNNPVPNGTALTFWAEGAAIEPSCVTSGGACTVKLKSQSPRPNTGRVSILARAIGEESFTDTSPTNGRYDEGENYQDLDEPFLDDNEDCTYNAGAEKFADFNNDGHRNSSSDPDYIPYYDGLLCNENPSNSSCNPNAETIFVSANTVIVLSGSTDLSVTPFLAGDLQLSPISTCGGDAVNSGSRVPVSSLSEVTLDCGQSIAVTVEDARGQVPPAGTTISAKTNQGDLLGPTTYTMASTNNYGPWIKTFFLDPAEQAGDGVFEITVATPNTEAGGTTTYTRSLSVLQRNFNIAATQPSANGSNLEIDTVDGATIQLSIDEENQLGFPEGTKITLSLSRGTINNGTELNIQAGQIGTFRHNIQINPTGSEGFGFLSITVTTPVVDGCNQGRTYFNDFQVEEVKEEEEP